MYIVGQVHFTMVPNETFRCFSAVYDYAEKVDQFSKGRWLIKQKKRIGDNPAFNFLEIQYYYKQQ